MARLCGGAWLAVVAVLCAACPAVSRATAVGVAPQAFRFANVYGDHMVLQQQPAKAVVWGFGEVGARVDVTMGDAAVSAAVDARGMWLVKLPPTHYGGPYTITAVQHSGTQGQPRSDTTIQLTDVLFGDVWICSGQSNMQFTVSQAFNATKEIAAAADFPNIRLFTAALVNSSVPLMELASIEEPWSVASPTSVGGKQWTYFSATCWFFGRDLYESRKYPIGLIDSDWGGTPIEVWMSPAALTKCNPNEAGVDPVPPPPSPADKAHQMFGAPVAHSVLWNAMIHPFLNMTIYGAAWYQGESNANAPNSYNCTFPAMINDWRLKWFEGTQGEANPLFPFGFVQLAPDGFTNVTVGGFPVIRWAQTADFGYVPNPKQRNVFMACAIDLGDPKSPYGSVHPQYKQQVGARLALAGRAIAYQEQGLVYSGPLVSSVHLLSHDSSGTTIQVNYTSTGTQGVQVRQPWGFEFQVNNTWIEAKAVYHSADSVHLVGPVLEPWPAMAPAMVRYAWRTDPCTYENCSVYSLAERLPSPPFIADVQ